MIKGIEEGVRSYLGLKYHLVGVKLIRNDSDAKSSPQPQIPMAFCQMVRMASVGGDSFLYGSDYERCPTAQVVLGFRDIRYSSIDCRVKPPETRKILVSPLDNASEMPDVVLAILTPKQMMDLTVILHAGSTTGLQSEFTGQHACAEFFAKPYMEGKPNMSLLCNGAREIYSDFRDNEITFGAPLDVYVQAAGTIERINKMGGALCGCRTSDMPTEIVNELEKVGFSRGTDYFFGKVNGRNIRLYIDKDLNGRLKFVTIHSPIRMPSEEMAEELTERLRPVLPRPYYANRRGYWLDLTAKATEDGLGVSLFDGFSVRAAIERFIEKTGQYVSQVGGSLHTAMSESPNDK